jgi:hypothetical protein
MNEAGYTLAETLAALLIIGLAFGGLSEGIRVIGLFQAATAATTENAASLWRLQDGLNRLLYRQGPFRSDEPQRFAGDATGFSFDCGRPKPCGAQITGDAAETRLTLTDSTGAHDIGLARAPAAAFLYSDGKTLSVGWPPPQDERRMLKSVLLVGRSSEGEAPIAGVRLWREQEDGCQFDPIAQDCRAVAP